MNRAKKLSFEKLILLLALWLAVPGALGIIKIFEFFNGLSKATQQ